MPKPTSKPTPSASEAEIAISPTRIRSTAQQLGTQVKETPDHSCGTTPLLPPTRKETGSSLHVPRRSVKDLVQRLNAGS